MANGIIINAGELKTQEDFMMDYEKMVRDMLTDVIVEFNEYSRIVALKKHNQADEGIYQWNRGNVYAYEQMAIKLAKKLGRKISFENRRYTYFKDSPEEFSLEYPEIYLTL